LAFTKASCQGETSSFLSFGNAPSSIET
jgi:hypothetical protein